MSDDLPVHGSLGWALSQPCAQKPTPRIPSLPPHPLSACPRAAMATALQVIGDWLAGNTSLEVLNLAHNSIGNFKVRPPVPGGPPSVQGKSLLLSSAAFTTRRRAHARTLTHSRTHTNTHALPLSLTHTLT